MTTTRIVEWDLPQNMDGRAGAIGVDLQSSGGSRLWFVTRNLLPRVYRFDVPKNLKNANAQFTSWPLCEEPPPAGSTCLPGPTGGVKKLKASYDRRVVFVRTVTGLHKVDTQYDKVTFYADSIPNMVSDVAADNSNRVYFAARGSFSDPVVEDGFIKRINASYHCTGGPCPNAEAIAWQVGGDVGNCTSGPSGSDPCISGIAVHPKYQNLVYYSDNAGNYIGELDANSKSCNCSNPLSKTRRWSLAPLGPEVMGPRQLNIDRDGMIWTVTNSGHLVSLDTKTNRMTKHKIPLTFFNDPFGVAPDGGFIGYTDTDEQHHKVAMLIPKANSVNCPPDTVWVPRTDETIPAVCENSPRTGGPIPPMRRTVPTQITPTNEGTFVEAQIELNSGVETRFSMLPLGITPDLDRSTGAFFFAVGQPDDSLVNRIGHTRLPRDKQKGKHDRDDEDMDDDGKDRGNDDDDDDDGQKNNDDLDDDDDGDPDMIDDDDDNDGIKNEYDTKTGKESQDSYSSQLAVGQGEDFEMIAGPTTIAMIATAVADDLVTPVSLEIRNASGAIVASTPATSGIAVITLVPSAAGTYTARVKNQGDTATGIATTLITRDPWVP